MEAAAETILRRIRFYQNRTKFKIVMSPDAIVSKTRHLKAYQPQPHKVEHYRFTERKRRKRGLLSTASHLNEEFKGYYGRVPYEFQDPTVWDFQITEPSGLKTVASQHRERSYKDNIHFWFFLCKRLFTLRDILPIDDVLHCLECLKHVNHYDETLLKVLVREIVQDMQKLSVEDVAAFLRVYKHFNCYSKELVEASAAYSLKALQTEKHLPIQRIKGNPKLPLHDSIALSSHLPSHNTSFSPTCLITWLDIFGQFPYFNWKLFAGVVSIFAMNHTLFLMDEVSSFLLALADTVKAHSLDTTFLKTLLNSIESKLATRVQDLETAAQQEDELASIARFAYSIGFVGNLNNADILLSSSKATLLEGLAHALHSINTVADTRTSKTRPQLLGRFDLLQTFVPPHSMSPYSLVPLQHKEAKAAAAAEEEEEEEEGDTYVFRHYEAFFEKETSRVEPALAPAIQSHLNTNKQRAKLLTSVGFSFSAIHTFWRAQIIMKLKNRELSLFHDSNSPADSINALNNTTTPKRPIAQREEAKNALYTFSQLNPYQWSTLFFDKMMQLQIHPLEEVILSNGCYIFYMCGTATLPASILCDILQVLAVYRHYYERNKNARQEDQALSFQRDNIKLLQLHESVHFLRDEKSMHCVLKDISLELSKKFLSLNPIEVQRLHYITERSDYKDPYLKHCLNKFSSRQRREWGAIDKKM